MVRFLVFNLFFQAFFPFIDLIEPYPGSEFYSPYLRKLRIRLFLFNPFGIFDKVYHYHQRITKGFNY